MPARRFVALLMLVLVPTDVATTLEDYSLYFGLNTDLVLSWMSRFAALSTLVLVPTDVATTLEDEPAALLWLWWRIVYW